MNGDIKSMNYLEDKEVGQSLIELVLFGAILMSVIGLIIQGTVSSKYFQDRNLKAAENALKMSHDDAVGRFGNRQVFCGARNKDPRDGRIRSYRTAAGSDGSGGRNTATVLIVDDRLSIGSGKLDTTDRVPYISQGSGTASRNMHIPHDRGECHSIPIFDLFVNGAHFPFLTGDFMTYDAEGMIVYKKVQNIPSSSDKWQNDSDTAFDLDRDGTFDVNGALLRNVFSWQWARRLVISTSEEKSVRGQINDIIQKSIAYVNTLIVFERDEEASNERIALLRRLEYVISGISEEQALQQVRLLFDGSFSIGRNEDQEDYIVTNGTFYDVDGDLKAEQVMFNFGDGRVEVLDYQEGDVDFAFNSLDQKKKASGDQKFVSGFLGDMNIYTEINATSMDRVIPGVAPTTYFLIEEGKLFSADTKQYHRTFKGSDQVDIISRAFQLARNTGRFCDLGYNNPPPWVAGVRNPVEVCCPDVSCCFGANIEKTCMAATQTETDRYPIIYIRTRRKSQRGRKWITDISEDPTVGILVEGE